MPFSDLPDRLREVHEKIEAAVRRGGHGQRVTIVAVTKTHGPEAVVAACQAGLRDVGENRVQEALAKQEALATMSVVEVPVRWHLIGHVQRNKVKHLGQFALVQSMDSERLADAIDAFGRQRGKPVRVLVQVNVVEEQSKGGYTLQGLPAESDRLRGLEGVDVKGVMAMAPLEADEPTLRAVFRGARRACEILCAAGHDATELSMGMSNDFEIAVEEGATCVRLGTILFGARAA